MNKTVIFLAYACDEWKSTSSMRLQMASLSNLKIRQLIEGKIEAQDMQYGDDIENMTPSEQAQAFHKDWKTKPRKDINDFLLYGFLDITHSGEEL